MSALSSRLAVATLLTLAVLIVTAGCDGGQSIPADEYVQQLVRDELQSIVSKLQSGMERLENRLESKMEALERRKEELTGRLDGQQTQLDEVVTQLNGQKSQQDETAVTVNDLTERLSDIAINMEKHVSEMRKLATRLDSQQSTLNTVKNVTAQLDTIVTQQGDQLNQTSQLAARIDSQQSQLSELNNQLNEQKTTQREASIRMDSLTSQVDILGSKLTGAINNTSSQLERIDDLAATVNHHHPPRDCSGLPVDSPSGVYLLRPSGDNKQPPVEAYCDMGTAGGNWTVFQRRDDIKPRQNFYRGWTNYKEGFGNVTKEFWWGLEHLFQLTSSGRQYELRVDMESFDGNRSYVLYQGFSVSSELDGYRLSTSDYSGPAGDGLYRNVNARFSTRDRDQDSSDHHCAQRHQGAWWYTGYVCAWSSLNGQYRDGGNIDRTGIWWWDWREFESLKKAEMKIRPTN